MCSRTYIYNGAIQREEGSAYKIMLSNWKAREGNFQYEVGKTYSMEEDTLCLCHSGFHYCEHPINCLTHYGCVPENKFSQVKIHGRVVQSQNHFGTEDKYATNIIEIYREINFNDWLELCTVTRLFCIDDRKYIEQTYVKGIMEKKIIYFSRFYEQPEDLINLCYTRIPDLFPCRYRLDRYHPDQTLECTTEILGETM
jgi:hypothetical protein